MFSGAFKWMSRRGNDGKEKSNSRSRMDKKDQNSHGYTKKLRAVEKGGGSSKGKKAARRKVSRARKETNAQMSGSRAQKEHRQQRTKNGYVCRIRTVEPAGLVVPGRHKDSKAVVRAAKPRTRKRAVDGRNRGIDFDDPGLPASERVKGAREGRGAAALLILSSFAKDEGWEWLKSQSSDTLEFVSGLIDRVENEETAVISKGELARLQKLDEEYTSAEPSWMQSLYAD
jgi:hypothetical protein